jgi:hypothetical protein
VVEHITGNSSTRCSRPYGMSTRLINGVGPREAIVYMVRGGRLYRQKTIDAFCLALRFLSLSVLSRSLEYGNILQPKSITKRSLRRAIAKLQSSQSRPHEEAAVLSGWSLPWALDADEPPSSLVARCDTADALRLARSTKRHLQLVSARLSTP